MTTTLDHGNIKMYDARTEELISPVTRVICYGVALLSFFAILSLAIGGILLGCVLLAASLLFLTAKKGVKIDFENSVYKEYTSLFGIQTGTWKKLFECKTITITPSGKMFSNNMPMGGAQTFSHSSKVNLNLKKDNYKKIVIANGTYDEVVKKAREVSAILNGVEIMDYTQKPAVAIR